jgi:hypothetical protein
VALLLGGIDQSDKLLFGPTQLFQLVIDLAEGTLDLLEGAEESLEGEVVGRIVAAIEGDLLSEPATHRRIWRF